MNEDVAIFRDEQDDQAIDQAQELAVVVLLVQLSRTKMLAQRVIGRVRQEAASQGGDGPLDAAAQLFERARPLLLGCARPLLQPARFWAFGLHARLVAEQ